MSNRIDQLFRSKLSEHSLPPSAEAWEKVNKSLSKKNSLIVFWRVAAVFALVGFLGAAWYFLSQPLENSSQYMTQTVTPELRTNTNNKEVTDSIKKTDLNQEIKNAKSKTFSTTHEKQMIREVHQTEHNNPTSLIDVQKLEVVPIEKTEEVAVALPEEKPEKAMVIEFTLPAVEEQVFTNAVTTNPETERSTGIMKFLETARDVKNGEAEFTYSLRDIKNELLALDLKKDKTRRN